MYFEKRYLQFNDLVFDGYDMISGYSEPVQYKGSSTAYSYTHGSYRAFKSNYLFVSERQVSMTITLKMKKIPCEYRKFYAQFAEQELSRAGRLWAIKNNEIIWAFAAVTNMNPIISGRKDEVVWDVEFTIPSGVWHKADKAKTFILPYDVCYLMDCKGFEEYSGECCCDTCSDNKLWEDMRDRCGCCCDSEITRDMALCNHLKELQQFYSCDTPYQLVYSCLHAEKFKTNKYLGHKLCVDDACNDNMIAGRFYSDTDFPTDELSVTIRGKMLNPSITINGNTNIIEGEYNGALTIEASGDVYYTSDECCEPELLDPSVWQIPNGMDYGWQVKPQLNSVIIDLNKCGQGDACVYIDADSITA